MNARSQEEKGDIVVEAILDALGGKKFSPEDIDAVIRDGDPFLADLMQVSRKRVEAFRQKYPRLDDKPKVKAFLHERREMMVAINTLWMFMLHDLTINEGDERAFAIECALLLESHINNLGRINALARTLKG